MLEEELADATFRMVSEHEKVQLRDGLRFRAHDQKREVTVTVNEQSVKLEGHTATGSQIMAAVKIVKPFIVRRKVAAPSFLQQTVTLQS